MLGDRFWSKVNKDTPSGCWEWTATKNNHGYGMFWNGKANRNKSLAHRCSYEDAKGTVEGGLFVLHRCDNPKCVKPDHLFAGTRADNSNDMYAKGRWKIDPAKYGTPPRFPGALNWNAKLTDDRVREYRAMLAAGKPLRQLARELGMNAKTIRDMRNGKTWRHVA